MHDPDFTHIDPPFGIPGYGMPGAAPFKTPKEQALAIRVVDILAWAPGALAKKVARTWIRELRRGAQERILNPNAGSEIKVERYVFAVNDTIKEIGKEQALSGTNSPDVNFRAQRLTANVTHPGMVLLTDGRVANVSFTVGGICDAWAWNPQATDQVLDLPTLTPANSAHFSGSYTGRVPQDMQDLAGKPYVFTLSLTGPAIICA